MGRELYPARADDLALFELADAEARAARKGKEGDKTREKAGDKRLGVELRTVARVEAVALDERIAETVKLAGLRGEKVERRGARLEIKSRDGLRHLFEIGRIDEPEYEAGKLYRVAYEATGAQFRSCLVLSPGASRGKGDGDRMLKLDRQRIRFEQIALDFDPSGRALELLRNVAGEGAALGVRGGKQFGRAAETLNQVLTRAAIEFGKRRA